MTTGALPFARAYVVTMRPYLLFVSGIAGITGLSLGPTVSLSAALAAGTAFFLAYGFGQALTDCFQLDTDSLSAPYRPMVQGQIGRRQVLAVSLVGLAGCGAVLIRLHPSNAVLAALTVGGLSTYTFFKRRWWGGPFYNAWIVALLVVMGNLAASGAAGTGRSFLSNEWGPGLAGAIITAFFGYANFVLTGYYKDLTADRRTGYRTFPVTFGLRWSNVLSDGFATLALAGVVVAVAGSLGASPSWTALPSVPFIALGTGAAALGQLRLHAVRDERDAHVAIVPVVHAYVLWLAGLSVLQRPAWAPAMLAFYVAFAITMARRPERTQV